VQLIEAAKVNRHGHRDATMILVAYRHGLRASEVCDLQWDDIDFGASAIHVARKKNCVSTTQQLNGQELRALRRLQRAQEPKSAYVFVTERGGPFDRTSFNFMVKRTARKAGYHSRRTPICSGTLPATRWPMPVANTRSIQAYLGLLDWTKYKARKGAFAC
jgi:integrase